MDTEHEAPYLPHCTLGTSCSGIVQWSRCLICASMYIRYLIHSTMRCLICTSMYIRYLMVRHCTMRCLMCASMYIRYIMLRHCRYNDVPCMCLNVHKIPQALYNEVPYICLNVHKVPHAQALNNEVPCMCLNVQWLLYLNSASWPSSLSIRVCSWGNFWKSGLQPRSRKMRWRALLSISCLPSTHYHPSNAILTR